MINASTSFRERVLKATRLIPRGKVTTYKLLAGAAGNAKACRAVGTILHHNPDPVGTPCCRVVRSTGALGGYALGTAAKRKRLRDEGIVIIGDRVTPLDAFLHRY